MKTAFQKQPGSVKIVLLMLVVLVTGCSTFLPEKSPATLTPSPIPITPSHQPQPTATITPEIPIEYRVEINDLRGSEILFLHPFVGAIDEQYQTWAEEFNHKNPYGITIKVESTGGLDTLPSMIQSRNPQVILTTPEFLSQGLEEGWLAALDGYLTLPELGLSEAEQKNIHEEFWLQDRFSGAQSGFPALRTAIGLIYNTTWANELGYTNPPSTPQEFLEQACTAARENNRSAYLDKRGTGGWLLSTDSLHAIAWWYTFGAKVLPEKPGEKIQFEQTSVATTFQFLRDMQSQGCLWQGLNPSPYRYFSERYTLFYIGSLQDIPPQQAYHQSLARKDDWTLIPFPRQNQEPFFLSHGFSYGLLRTEPKLQMAGWLWIRWLADPSRQSTLTHLYQGMPLGNSSQNVFFDPILEKHFMHDASLIPLPGNPDWLIARRPVEDAFWQIFHLAEGQSVEEVMVELQSLTEYELSRTQATPIP